jgi:DNA-binding IscR family transcriptional regulator
MVTNRQNHLTLVVEALLVLLDSPRGMATSAEMATVLEVNPVVVRRLLAALRSDGIVESRSGPKGGWAVPRDPATITLARIYRAASPEPDVVSPAALDEALLRAEAAYVAELEKLTLGELQS